MPSHMLMTEAMLLVYPTSRWFMYTWAAKGGSRVVSHVPPPGERAIIETTKRARETQAWRAESERGRVDKGDGETR